MLLKAPISKEKRRPIKKMFFYKLMYFNGVGFIHSKNSFKGQILISVKNSKE